MAKCRQGRASACESKCSTDCKKCEWCAAANIHGWGDGRGGWIKMRGGHTFDGTILRDEMIDYGPVRATHSRPSRRLFREVKNDGVA